MEKEKTPVLDRARRVGLIPEKEFNLSEKEIELDADYVYRRKHIKEFIKRLKEDFTDGEQKKADDTKFTFSDCEEEYIVSLINKLAGDKFA